MSEDATAVLAIRVGYDEYSDGHRSVHRSRITEISPNYPQFPQGTPQVGTKLNSVAKDDSRGGEEVF